MRRTAEAAHRGRRAFTRTEIVAVVSVLAVLTALAVPWLVDVRKKALRIGCVSRLKNIGLSFRIFATDRTNKFPWQLTADLGGTSGYTSDVAQTWRHFLPISNELSTPVILRCPADHERPKTTSFSAFNGNHQLSYFIGMGASELAPDSIMAGDRNLLLDGAPIEGRLVTVPSNAVVAFDHRIHRDVGNILFGDGSVRQVTSSELNDAVRRAAVVSTNLWLVP